MELKKDTDIIKFFNELILNELKEFNCWVQGGSILSFLDDRPINDIDIFFKKKEERESCLNFLIKNGGIISIDNIDRTEVLYNNKKIDLSKNSLKYDDTSPQKSIDSVDFTICGIATDGNVVYKLRDFDSHWKKKLIVYKNYMGSSIHSFYRVQKYLTRGYSLDNKETVNLLRRLRFSTDEEIKKEYGI